MSLLDDLQESSDCPYWSRRKKPLLVTVHEYLRRKPVHESPQLEMFSLNTWVTNVDLSKIVKTNIDIIVEAKRFYHSVKLKDMCVQFINQNYHNCYKIFTDGSKDMSRVGAAVFDPQLNCSIKLNIQCNVSIMYAELIAIAEALSYAESLDCGDYVIFSDSKSALQHLARCTSKTRGTPIAYDILRSICNVVVNGNKNVIIQWVPAHIGLIENEKADNLAKEALTDGLNTACVPFFTDVLYVVRDQCTKLWSEYFNVRSLTKGIWYKTIQPNISRLPWIDQANMSRADTIMALRLRSGHIPLNSFAYLMGKVESPHCSICNMVEDVQHVLMECTRNKRQREQLFLRNYDVGKCNSILAFPYSEEAKMLYSLARAAFVNR